VPRGFTLNHGHITHIDPVAALFNPAWPTETAHMVFGALLATAFGVASVYAIGMLRGRRDGYHRRGLALGMSAAAILAPLQLAVGDLLGRTVAHNQPAKLAAIEGQFHTEHGAGLNLGGFPVPGQEHAILNLRIPNILSLLAYDDPHATVRGLASFPKADQTPLALPVRLSFLGMVGIGTFLIGLSVWYWLRHHRRHTSPSHPDRLTLIALVSAGPLAFLANELGWMVTEFGRQPWVIYGVLRTSHAITAAPGLGVIFAGFALVYVVLSGMTVWLLRRLATGAPAVRQAAPDLAVAA
jgi:cytochrome d ubiquinol oxidase subunit I